MKKTEFYDASLRRDAELARWHTRVWLVMLSAIALLIATLFFFGPSGYPLSYAFTLGAVFLAIVFGSYIPLARRQRAAINRRHGMTCAPCGAPFEWTALTQVAFTSRCAKCGQPAFESPPDQPAKQAFYDESLKRNAELERAGGTRAGWIPIAVCLLPWLLLVVFAPDGFRLPYATYWFAAWVVLVLSIWARNWKRKYAAINKKHGMACAQCGNPFEWDALTHLGFTGKCGKCGAVVLESDPKERTSPTPGSF